nr:sulfite reductase flavoprotein subunit alpha [Marinomonas ostreistagni]
MAGVLLYSKVFLLTQGSVAIAPWWTLFLIVVPCLSVYFDVRKRLPSQAGQRSALIAYASQTGSAKRLAEQLHKAAQPLVDLRCVSQLSAQQLQSYQRVFFVVSTHGNGAAPDAAHKLVHELQTTQAASCETKFSVLALGDRTYQTFCAFGYQLSDLLDQKGFKRLLPLQEVDRMDLRAVETWWQQIAQLLGLANQKVALQYDEFVVQQNECLNPQQALRLAYRIRLCLPGVRYQPGDVLAVMPQVNRDSVRQRLERYGFSGSEAVQLAGQRMLLLDALTQLEWEYEQADTPQALVDQLTPLHERLYSIASCEPDYVELLVRQHWRADGTLGIASGYLTQLQPGQRIEASLREHTSFHLVGDVPLIMIGAGTGLAPFMGFLQQKQNWGSETENWLLFGEQYFEHDAYFHDALQRFQDEGVLTRFHTAWSRTDGLYVQSLLTMHEVALREWVEHKGAHIYLCGSRQGFGEAVNDTLREIIPEQYLSERLHTDLY